MSWSARLLVHAPTFDSFSDWCLLQAFTCQWGNCLDYAVDEPPDPDANPCAIRFSPANSRSDIRRGLKGAGLREVPAWVFRVGLWRWWCRGEGHLMAVAFGPDTIPMRVPPTDFHCYRLDSGGYWSHKPGDQPAREVDESGARITDPRTADRGEYPVFLGFWWVRRCRVRSALAVIRSTAAPGH